MRNFFYKYSLESAMGLSLASIIGCIVLLYFITQPVEGARGTEVSSTYCSTSERITQYRNDDGSTSFCSEVVNYSESGVYGFKAVACDPSLEGLCDK